MELRIVELLVLQSYGRLERELGLASNDKHIVLVLIINPIHTIFLNHGLILVFDLGSSSCHSCSCLWLSFQAQPQMVINF